MKFYTEKEKNKSAMFIPGLYYIGELRHMIREYGAVQSELVYGKAHASEILPEGKEVVKQACDVYTGKLEIPAILVAYKAAKTIKGLIFKADDEVSASVANRCVEERLRILRKGTIKEMLEEGY